MANSKLKKAAAEGSDEILGSLAKPTQESPINQDEAQALMEAQETRGHKGVKMPRINAAFTPSNYEYLRVMSGIHGQTITGYLNDIVAKDREANADIYEKAKALVKSAKK